MWFQWRDGETVNLDKISEIFFREEVWEVPFKGPTKRLTIEYGKRSKCYSDGDPQFVGHCHPYYEGVVERKRLLALLNPDLPNEEEFKIEEVRQIVEN